MARGNSGDQHRQEAVFFAMGAFSVKRNRRRSAGIMTDYYTPASEEHIEREKQKGRELRRSQWGGRNRRGEGRCHYCNGRFPPKELTMDPRRACRSRRLLGQGQRRPLLQRMQCCKARSRPCRMDGVSRPPRRTHLTIPGPLPDLPAPAAAAPALSVDSSARASGRAPGPTGAIPFAGLRGYRTGPHQCPRPSGSAGSRRWPPSLPRPPRREPGD